jgi:hypothetical protein
MRVWTRRWIGNGFAQWITDGTRDTHADTHTCLFVCLFNNNTHWSVRTRSHAASNSRYSLSVPPIHARATAVSPSPWSSIDHLNAPVANPSSQRDHRQESMTCKGSMLCMFAMVVHVCEYVRVCWGSVFGCVSVCICLRACVFALYACAVVRCCMRAPGQSGWSRRVFRSPSSANLSRGGVA